MKTPEHLHQHVGECIAVELEGARRRAYWAVILGLRPYLDGDRWCVLWGEDLQTGIAGFGASPELAIMNFDRTMAKEQSEVVGDQ